MSKELETTYRTQMKALAAVNPDELPLTLNKLLKAVDNVAR